MRFRSEYDFKTFFVLSFLVERGRRERRFDSNQELFGLVLQLSLRSVLYQFGLVGISVLEVRSLSFRSLCFLLASYAFEVLHSVFDALQNG